MYIFYNVETSQFTVKEYLPMKGKIISGQIAQKIFFDLYNEYLNEKNKRETLVKTLSAKIEQEKDNEELVKQYRAEFIKLINTPAPQPPSVRRFYTIKMRVVGHDNGITIVEPYDKRCTNLLKRIGYYGEE